MILLVIIVAWVLTLMIWSCQISHNNGKRGPGLYLARLLLAIQPAVCLMVNSHPSMLHGHLTRQGHVFWVCNAVSIQPPLVRRPLLSWRLRRLLLQQLLWRPLLLLLCSCWTGRRLSLPEFMHGWSVVVIVRCVGHVKHVPAGHARFLGQRKVHRFGALCPFQRYREERTRAGEARGGR